MPHVETVLPLLLYLTQRSWVYCANFLNIYPSADASPVKVSLSPLYEGWLTPLLGRVESKVFGLFNFPPLTESLQHIYLRRKNE